MAPPHHAAYDRLRFTLLSLSLLCLGSTVGGVISMATTPLGNVGWIGIVLISMLCGIYGLAAYLHLERRRWFRTLLFGWWVVFPVGLVAAYRPDYPNPSQGPSVMVIGSTFAVLVVVGHFMFGRWSAARWWVGVSATAYVLSMAAVSATWTSPGIAIGISGAAALLMVLTVLCCWAWQNDYFVAVGSEGARREEAEAARRLARCADESKSAFIASMSHELRTPLTAILGYVEAAIEDLDSGLFTRESLISDLDVVARSAHGLVVDIDAVLDLSKVEQGDESVEVRQVDLAFLVRRCLERVRPMAMKKSVELEFELEPTLVSVLTDEKRLQHVLMNLIGNAVKFTDAGYVRVVGCRTDGGVRLEVQDTGVGIHPAVLHRVFERFERTQAEVVGRTVGSGLGLAIAREEVSRLGGVLDVTSVLGEGSCFSMELPVEAAA